MIPEKLKLENWKKFSLKGPVILTGLLIFAVGITLTVDYWESRFQHYSYYFSESFLFSSFWWLVRFTAIDLSQLVESRSSR